MFHCINQLFQRHFAISKMSVVDIIQKLINIIHSSCPTRVLAAACFSLRLLRRPLILDPEKKKGSQGSLVNVLSDAGTSGCLVPRRIRGPRLDRPGPWTPSAPVN